MRRKEIDSGTFDAFDGETKREPQSHHVAPLTFISLVRKSGAAQTDLLSVAGTVLWTQ